MKTKQEVLEWFGNRGIDVKPKWLKKWHWQDGRLWFVIKGSDGMDICDTDLEMVDLANTHRDDGSSITVFERQDTKPLVETPLAGIEDFKAQAKNLRKEISALYCLVNLMNEEIDQLEAVKTDAGKPSKARITGTVNISRLDKVLCAMEREAKAAGRELGQDLREALWKVGREAIPNL